MRGLGGTCGDRRAERARPGVVWSLCIHGPRLKRCLRIFPIAHSQLIHTHEIAICRRENVFLRPRRSFCRPGIWTTTASVFWHRWGTDVDRTRRDCLAFQATMVVKEIL